MRRITFKFISSEGCFLCDFLSGDIERHIYFFDSYILRAQLHTYMKGLLSSGLIPFGLRMLRVYSARPYVILTMEGMVEWEF